MAEPRGQERELLVLFPLLFMLAADEIRFSSYFVRELALGPLMNLGRFDLAVKMAHSTVVGVACHRTHGRYALFEGSLTWDCFP